MNMFNVSRHQRTWNAIPRPATDAKKVFESLGPSPPNYPSSINRSYNLGKGLVPRVAANVAVDRSPISLSTAKDPITTFLP